MSRNDSVKIVGIGDAGGYAINRLIDEGITQGDFIVANSSFQSLLQSKARTRLQLGGHQVNGLGAGGDPAVGKRMAESVRDDLYEILRLAETIYLVAGLGGGTGSGASPVIASIAQDLRAQTVAVITLPFRFEGSRRGQIADRSREQLEDQVNELIVLPNDRLQPLLAENPPLQQAFSLAAGTLAWSVISRLISPLS